MWNWWNHRNKILSLFCLAFFLEASPIRSHILREEILALQQSIPFPSFFLAKHLEKWPPAQKEKLPEVYQWILEGNREKLLDLSPKSFPEDPYFFIALGRLIAFPEGKVNPSLSLRKQAYEFFQKALVLGQKQKDPYVEWILRKWFPEDLYQRTKDIFFLYTQILDSHMGWLISPQYRLEKKISEFPADADFLRDMGEFLWRMGKKEEAGKVWERAAQVVPPGNLEAKAQLLTKIGEYNQALEIYKILYRNSGSRNYILSILSQYAQKERLSEKEKIERARWQIEAGFFYSALQGLDALEAIYLQALEYAEKGALLPEEFGDIPRDAGTLKALLVEIDDLQGRAIVGILRNLAELLKALGLGGTDLEEARLDQAPYFHSLRVRKEIQSESLDFMGFLLGMCGTIPSGSEWKRPCQMASTADPEKVHHIFQRIEPEFIPFASTLIQFISGRISEKKKVPFMLHTAARWQISLGNVKKAIFLMELASPERVEYAEFHYDLGSYYLQDNKPKEALQALTRAKELGWKDASLYRKIARCHILQGKPLQAVHSLQEGIQDFPDSLELYEALLEMAREYKALQTAEFALTHLVQLSTPPTKFIWLYQLALHYLKIKQPELSIPLLRELYENQWNDAQLYNFAEAWVQEKLPIIPEVERFPLFATYLRVAYKVSENRLEDAVEILHNALQRNPDYVPFRAYQAQLLGKAQHLEEAIKIYRELEKTDLLFASDWEKNAKILEGVLAGG
ncbi:MAG: hypothetical protein V2G48_06225 [bacterium JZ-2024 1]